MLRQVSAAVLPQVTIRPAAIRHNLQLFSSLFRTPPRLIVMVKGDAYGHGMLTAAAEASGLGHRLGVATIDEVMTLHKHGYRNVFVAGPIFPCEAEMCVECEATPFVGSPVVLTALNDAAARLGKRATVHLEFDTGMGRFGFLDMPDVPVDVDGIADMLRGLPHVQVTGVMTHYASSPEPLWPDTRRQFQAFGRIVEQLAAHGIQPDWVHCSNSAAAMHFPDTCLDTARVGLFTYGLYAGDLPAHNQHVYKALEPVMTWTAQVVDVRRLPAGTPISYNSNYHTDRPSRIAALNVGYANGYPRHASNKETLVGIGGMRFPVVGNVTMNFILVDVTEAPFSIEPGTPVLLFGRDGDDLLRMDELSAYAGTIPYETGLLVHKTLNRWQVDSSFQVPRP